MRRRGASYPGGNPTGAGRASAVPSVERRGVTNTAGWMLMVPQPRRGTAWHRADPGDDLCNGAASRALWRGAAGCVPSGAVVSGTRRAPREPDAERASSCDCAALRGQGRHAYRVPSTPRPSPSVLEILAETGDPAGQVPSSPRRCPGVRWLGVA